MVETLFTLMFLASLFGMPLAVVAGVLLLAWPGKRRMKWHVSGKHAIVRA